MVAARRMHSFCSLFDPRFRLASSRTAVARLRAPLHRGAMHCGQPMPSLCKGGWIAKRDGRVVVLLYNPSVGYRRQLPLHRGAMHCGQPMPSLCKGGWIAKRDGRVVVLRNGAPRSSPPTLSRVVKGKSPSLTVSFCECDSLFPLVLCLIKSASVPAFYPHFFSGL